MTLTRIADLIGKDISGTQADIRSRNADGSLRHSHTENLPESAYMVTMKRVEFYREKAGPTLKRMYGKDVCRWMRWTWNKRDSAVYPFDCGYSGQCAEDDEHGAIYLRLQSV